MASFAELDRDRNNNFDFLRLALSVAVIFSHCYLLTGSTAEPFNRLVHGQALLGWTAVNFFFAISGYLITSSWLRCKGSVDYLRRRVLRIHPGFIVAVFFCFLIAAPLGADHAVEYFHRPTAYLSLLLPVFYSSTVAVSFPHNPLPGVVNGSLWTIPCEFLMYLLVMLLGLIGVVRRRWLVLGLFIAVLIGHRSLGRFAPPLAAMHLPYFGFVHVLLRLSTYFLAGMTLRVFHDRIPHSLVLFIASLLVLLACQRRGLDNFLPVLGVYALFHVAYSRKLPLQHFGRFGDFSYGSYLYAFPIQQLILKYISPSLSPMKLFVLATPLTLLAAFASWHLIEKRFLTLKHTRLALPEQPPAAGSALPASS